MGSKFVILSAFIALVVSSLHAEAEKLHANFGVIGYDFKASYKLRLPSSKKASAKHIVLKASMGPSTARNMIYSTQRPFIISLEQLDSKGRKKVCGLNFFDFGDQIESRKTNIKSPLLYSGFQKLLSQIVDKYDTMPKSTQKANSKLFSLSKEAKKIRIKPLPGTALDMEYRVKITSDLPPNFQYAKTAEVSVRIALESLKKHKGKVITATVFAPHLKVPYNMYELNSVKFALTKNSLHALSRENIQRTNPWYRLLKEAAKKSIEKYIELNAKHIKSHAKAEERI